MSWSYLVGPTAEDTPDLIRNGNVTTKANNYATVFVNQPQVAGNVTSLASRYPNISPGLAWALGSSGQGPSPMAERAWQAEIANELGKEPGTVAGPKRKPRSRVPDLRGAAPLTQAQINELPDRQRALYYRGAEKLFGRAVKLLEKGWNPDIEKESGNKSVNEFNRVARRNPEVFGGMSQEDLQSLAEGYVTPRPSSGGGLLSPFTGNKPDPLGTQALPVLGTAVHGIGDVAKPVVRTAALAGQTGYEALSAGLRLSQQNAPSAPANFPDFLGGHVGESTITSNDPLGAPRAIAEQTTAGQAAKQAYSEVFEGEKGEGVDVGGGYFPSLDSKAAQAQADAARKYSPYLVGGHAWTPGRAVANIAFTPDDTTFDVVSGLIDGATAWKGDPTAAALTTFGLVRKARDTLVADDLLDAGLVHGYRKTHIPTRVSEFMNRDSTIETLGNLASIDDPWTIVHGSNGRIPYYLPDGTPLAAQLADTKNLDEVVEVLRPHLGTQIDKPFGFTTPSVKPRLAEDVPARMIDFGMDADLNQAAYTADMTLSNMRASLQQRQRIANLYARAGQGGPDRYAAANATWATIGEQLRTVGVPDEVAAKAETMFDKEFTGMVSYADDAMGNPLTNSTVAQIGKDGLPIPHPVFPDQFLNSKITLPDPREMRTLTSSLKPLFDNPVYGGTEAAMDAIMGVWRRSVLIRPAFMTRIVGEEQIRIATEGYSSLFRHPFDAATYVIGNPDPRWIEKFTSRESKLAQQVGESLAAFKERVGRQPFLLGGLDPNDDMFTQGLYSRFSDIRSQNKVYLNDWVPVSRHEENYAEALAEQAARHHSRQMSREALKKPASEYIQSFWDGDLKRARQYMSRNPGYERLATEPLAAQEHAEVAMKTVSEFTQGNPKLVEAVVDGTIDGIPVLNRNGNVNKRALEKFTELIDAGTPLPQVVSKRRTLGDAVGAKRGLEYLDHAFNYLFDMVGTRPSNYFSRNPTLNQAYLDKWQDLFPHLAAKDRTKLLKEVDAANLKNVDTSWFHQVDTHLAGREAAGQGLDQQLSYANATLVAKHHAVKATKDLLYDLSKRTQIFDVMRLMFPFGEAWKEILTTWGRLAYQNPQVLRRLPQIVEAGRGEKSDALNRVLGGTDMPGGFLHKDSFGTEVFTYPGSEFLTKATLGVPIPFSGSVTGLNMVGNIIPGIGPAAQIPLAALIPDTPQWQTVSEWLFPFGRPSTSIFEAVPEAFMPKWLDKFRIAASNPDQVRNYGAAVIDVMKVKASSGDYDLQGPDAVDELARLVAESKVTAKWVMVLRGVGQSALPTAPAPEWLAHDKNGRLTLLWRAAQWYHDRAHKPGADSQEVLSNFLDKFGSKNFLIPQAKSKAIVQGADRLLSSAGSKWAASHSELGAKYPNVYGLFAPDSKDYGGTEAYERQFRTGERKPFTPRDAARAANGRLASLVYEHALEQVGDTIDDEENQQLRRLRRDLMEQFPGYHEKDLDFSNTERVMLELRQAAKDPEIAKTPAAKALKRYFRYRQQVLDDQDRGDGPVSMVSTAAYNVDNRAWLVEWGEELSKKTPTFRPMWDAILSREVEEQ